MTVPIHLMCFMVALSNRIMRISLGDLMLFFANPYSEEYIPFNNLTQNKILITLNKCLYILEQLPSIHLCTRTSMHTYKQTLSSIRYIPY